jgi:hypothetical protein
VQVFDNDRGVIRIFGGMGTGGARTDVWEFGGTLWTQIANTGSTPPARAGLAGIYDHAKHRDVLQGGGTWTDSVTSVGISEQPSSSATCQGSGVSLHVASPDTGPFTYQWTRAGQPLPPSDFIVGADSDTLNITSVPASLVGTYRCIVSDACGTSTSEVAAVEVDGTVLVNNGSFEGDGMGWDYPSSSALVCDAGGSHTGSCYVALADTAAGQSVTQVLAKSLTRTSISQISVWAKRHTRGVAALIYIAGWNQGSSAIDWATHELTDEWELYPLDPNASGVGDDIEVLIVGASDSPDGGVAYSADIDDVVLRVRCSADFNCDGGIDGSDLDAFFRAWESGDLSADANQDGGVDASDVDAFFTAWSKGGC